MRRSSSRVIRCLSNSPSWSLLRYNPFLGSVLSVGEESAQGFMWLATSSSGVDMPVMQHLRS